MPLYTWRCKKCGAELDVLRSFDGFRDPPTEEEESHGCEGQVGGHEWDKVIHSPAVARGAGWGGGKGNW